MFVQTEYFVFLSVMLGENLNFRVVHKLNVLYGCFRVECVGNEGYRGGLGAVVLFSALCV